MSDKIANTVFKAFDSLPKKGKPSIKSNGKVEWTVLAAIVYSKNSEFKCVALGTGTKCLGEKSVSLEGDIVHDSHAEVICRRSFILYLLNQIRLIIGNKSSETIQLVNGKFMVNPGIKFYLYISQAPCGDASMSALSNSQTDEQREINQVKRLQYSESVKCKADKEESKEGGEIKRTNADEIFSDNGKVKRGRLDYDLTGSLRTKPGRLDSDPSISMSCTDKIAKWNVMGFSGRLLSLFFETPIYLESIIVSEFFDEESMRKSLVERVEGVQGLPESYTVNSNLKIEKCLQMFPFGKAGILEDMSSMYFLSAISWVEGMDSEVLVSGRKQGAGKKKGVWLPTSRDMDLDNMTISDLRKLSGSYQSAKQKFLTNPPFDGWLLREEISKKDMKEEK
ncbi:hypothetical protein HK098_003398 [Nowakowskiella sp. JEL0407]|nr:hypothetical protein HK098_003398 [Nowakowskiella sp. JEL0407]